MFAYGKESAMSKIKEAKRSIKHSILQIMPAEGWVAVFQDDDGTLSETVRVPLFAWAIVREIDKKTAHTQVTGLHIDDEGQIRASCWSDGFLRYERIEITERPQSSGK
jgi:hypothetical protein